jgi:hypothetical protein
MDSIQFSALICILAFIAAIPKDNRLFISLCAFWVTVCQGIWKYFL